MMSSSPPIWAQDLILDALSWWEDQGHSSVNVPIIKWKHRKGRGTTGLTIDKKTIIIREGNRSINVGGEKDVSALIDTKVVVLHELAHFLTPSGEHHGPQFWDTAWAFFQWAELPVWYLKWREGAYRKGALSAARRARI